MQSNERKARRHLRRKLRRLARKFDVSVALLETCPIWYQEGRNATEEEYTAWARSQHKSACQEYQVAWPVIGNHGKCIHYIIYGRPCKPQYAHTGMCWSGHYEPEGHHFTWGDMGKAFRNRQAKAE